MSSAGEILKSATELVAGERASTHGDKLINHQKIATLWNAYLTIRKYPDDDLGPHDVALMMALLKVARTQLGDFNIDDYQDLAGYAGCAGEIRGRIDNG